MVRTVMKYQSTHPHHGFTLIELLVVIAVMGIITAIATASYSTAQKKARDSRRISDMKAIQNAFEQSYAENHVYPDGCAIDTQFMPMGLPSNPNSNADYTYSSLCDSTTYCYCAPLEATTGNETEDCNSGATIGRYYCVNNLQ